MVPEQNIDITRTVGDTDLVELQLEVNDNGVVVPVDDAVQATLRINADPVVLIEGVAVGTSMGWFDFTIPASIVNWVGEAPLSVKIGAGSEGYTLGTGIYKSLAHQTGTAMGTVVDTDINLNPPCCSCTCECNCNPIIEVDGCIENIFKLIVATEPAPDSVELEITGPGCAGIDPIVGVQTECTARFTVPKDTLLAGWSKARMLEKNGGGDITKRSPWYHLRAITCTAAPDPPAALPGVASDDADPDQSDTLCCYGNEWWR